MTISIDLNADLGEGMPHDDELLAVVSSASIACGGHAGDESSIRRALDACRQNRVRAGAHPGYADKANFGRVRLDLPLDAVLEQVGAQLALIRRIAGDVGYPLSYLKLHGALANVAAEDLALATAIFKLGLENSPALAVLAIDNSMQVRAAETLGLTVIREAYADRAYLPNGLLVPRSQPGAVLGDTRAVVERCLRLAQRGEIVAVDGSVIKSRARSICLHGDTPGAVELARRIREALDHAGIAISAEA